MLSACLSSNRKVMLLLFVRLTDFDIDGVGTRGWLTEIFRSSEWDAVSCGWCKSFALLVDSLRCSLEFIAGWEEETRFRPLGILRNYRRNIISGIRWYINRKKVGRSSLYFFSKLRHQSSTDRECEIESEIISICEKWDGQSFKPDTYSSQSEQIMKW